MAQAATSLRSVAWLTVLTFGQMTLQFAFQILLAKQFGAEAEMDAFVAALTLPMVLSGMIAGALGSAFVPVYVETKERSGETTAWTMAVQVLCWVFLSTFLLWQALRHFAEPVMRVLHPGFDDLTVWDAEILFRSLSGLLLWNSLSGVARAWNHSRGRFAITGIAAVAGNAVMLGVAWMGTSEDVGADERMLIVSRGVVFGSVVTFALQMPWLQLFARGWPASRESQAAVKRCLMPLVPLLVMLACTQLDPLLDRYLSSQMVAGTVARLGYASRLAGAVLTLATSGLAVVAFPAMAAHFATRDEVQLRTEIAAALRFLILLLVPVVVALIGFSQPLIRDFLQRGRFTSEDAHIVALLLAALCGQIAAGSAGEVASKVYFAGRSLRTPLIVGLSGLGLGIILKFWWSSRWGVTGLAAATSTYYFVSAIVLWSLIARRYGSSIFFGVCGMLIRTGFASAAAALVGSLVLRVATTWSLRWPAFCGAVAGAIVFGFVLIVLRDEVAWRALRMLGIGRQASSSDSPQEPNS